MSKLKTISIYLIIAAVTVFMVIAWGSFQSDAYLHDDNRTQWFPIIEKAYEDFFETGTMPLYNFYLSKGLAIGEPGYYSLTNPVMMIAYLLSGLFPGKETTVLIYICIHTLLGNIIMYTLCREIKCSITVSVAVTAAYFSCSAFISFYIWYYIFVNYMFIPLILWAFIKLRNTRLEYIGCGIILAFDLLMGNVQYTCYHYMLFCIICVIMTALKEFRYFKVMLTNIAAGLALSLPYLGLLLNSSGGLEHNGFLSSSLTLTELLMNAFIPKSIFYSAGILEMKIHYPRALLHYMGGVLSAVLICLAAAVIKAFRNKSANKEPKQNKSRNIIDIIYQWVAGFYNSACSAEFHSKLLVGIVVGLILFVLIMNRGFVAYILSIIPVVNQFRYLYKAIFIIVPLCAVTMAFVLVRQSKKIKIVALSVSIVFSIIGVVNNFYAVDCTESWYNISEAETFDGEKKIADRLNEQNGIDTKNYRTICLFQGDDMPSTREKTFRYYENMTRNFPAYTESFSLSAYEISVSKDRLSQFDYIYDPEELYTVYANAGYTDFLVENLKESPDELQAQLVSNSVKYIIINDAPEEADDYEYSVSEIAALLDGLDKISVVSTKRYGEEYALLELDGVNSLCVDESGSFTNLYDDEMDLLRFTADGSGSYTLSFAYDKNLLAYTFEGDERVRLEITESADGNAIVHTNGITGDVFLTYSSLMGTAATIMEIVITLAFLGVIAALIYLTAKGSGQIISADSHK